MKFAYLVMGNFNENDRKTLENETARIIGVSSLEEAKKVAKELLEEGIDSIELCGAFGSFGAKRIVDAVENKIPIGYVTYLPEQREICKKYFPNEEF